MTDKNTKSETPHDLNNENKVAPAAAPENAAMDCAPDKLAKELEQTKANYMRSLADLENLRKRHAREREEFLQYGNAALISNILPVVDNFEIALKAAEEHHPEAKALLEGLGMIIPQLQQTLKGVGVEIISPKAGDVFDPNLHQSVGEAPSDTVAHHAVLVAQRPGYKLYERLLRPAMVVLSSGKAK